MPTAITSSKTGTVAISSSTVFPTKSSVPTGTISVAANSTMITGSGTNFSQFQVGDWIVDLTNFEMHKIVNIPTIQTSETGTTQNVKSDLYCTVDAPFQNALAGATLVIVTQSHIVKANIYVASGGKINNVAMPVGWIPEFTRPGVQQNLPIDPFFVDGSGGTVTIMFSYQ